MTLRFTCTCGKRLRARDEMASRRSMCPACGRPVGVPPLRPHHPGGVEDFTLGYRVVPLGDSNPATPAVEVEEDPAPESRPLTYRPVLVGEEEVAPKRPPAPQ